MWRDKEKVGERRENHQAQPPAVLTSAKACRDDFEDLIQKYRGDNVDNEEQWSDTSEEIKDEKITTCQVAFPLAIRALPPNCHTIFFPQVGVNLKKRQRVLSVCMDLLLEGWIHSFRVS